MMSRYKLNALLVVTLAVLSSGPVAASAATMTGEPRAMVTAGKMAESAIPSTENIAQRKEKDKGKKSLKKDKGKRGVKNDKGKRGLKTDKAKKWIKKINERTGNLKNNCKAAASRLFTYFPRYARTRTDLHNANNSITHRELQNESRERSISLPIMANAAVEAERDHPSWSEQRVLNWVIDQNRRHYWNAFYGQAAEVLLEDPNQEERLFGDEPGITQRDIENYIAGPPAHGCTGDNTKAKREKRGDRIRKEIIRNENKMEKDRI